MLKDDPSFAAGDEGPGVQGMELNTHHSLRGTLNTMYGTTNKRIKDIHATAS
jgi:hypothetical protein